MRTRTGSIFCAFFVLWAGLGLAAPARAGVLDSAKKKLEQAKDKAKQLLEDAKQGAKDLAHKAGAWVGSLGGLTELMEPKCALDKSGQVPLVPGGAAPEPFGCEDGAARCPNDVTDKVTVVGSPLEAAYPKGDQRFARNIWDLHAFQGKLYIGHGNSNNKGPAPNAGPVAIWSYDPSSGKFQKEWVAPDEQVDHFRVIGGMLLTPGHDPKESWVKGNFYRLEKNGWTKVRTIPGAIHNYDMIEHGGQMFAALGTPLGGVVARSTNGGQSWSPLFAFKSFRVYTLFDVAGRLHASASAGKFYAYDGSKLQAVSGRDFFTGEKVNAGRLRVVRPESFRSQAVYIGACAVIDHNWIPVGLFTIGQSGNARVIPLPGGARPRDTLVRDGVLYVLASTAAASGHVVQVFSTKDLQRWSETLRFRADTFARSFELLGGSFYFGLGSEAEKLTDSTGRILRVAR